MSSNYPPPSGIGNFATAISKFAEGYQGAKMRQRDEEDRSRARIHDHANNILQVLDSPIAAQNPSMRASLMEAYADALDKAEAGPQKKKKQEGVGALVKRMFGMGGYDAPEPQGPGAMRTMLDNSEKARQEKIKSEMGPAAEPGRGDYGTSGLANFLGPASNPISTQTPEAPMSRETPKPSAFPMTPDQQMSREPAVSPVAQYAQQPRTMSPQQTTASKAYSSGNFIAPDKLVRSATMAHTGKYGFQDTAAIQRDVKTKAHEIISDLMDDVHSFIDVTPGHETLEQAMAHPQIRQALEGVRQYAHLTGQKFDDIIGGHFAGKAEEPTKYTPTQLDYGNNTPYPANYNAATGKYYHPNTGAEIRNPKVYEKPSGATPPPTTRVYDYFVGKGMTPDEALKKVNEIDKTAQSERQRYEAGLMTAVEAQAFINRIRALDKPGAGSYDDLEKYRVSMPGSEKMTTAGFERIAGGNVYDVGGLIDAIRNSDRTGMTLKRVQDALVAYQQADPKSPDAIDLGKVVAAFNSRDPGF